MMTSLKSPLTTKLLLAFAALLMFLFSGPGEALAKGTIPWAI